MAERQGAVFFDLDNTLHNTKEYIVQAFEYALEKHGYPAKPRAEIEKHIGKTLRQCYEILAPKEVNLEELFELHIKYQKDHPGLVVPFPEALNSIRKIRAAGKKTAVITSRTRESALDNLNVTGVGLLMDFVVTKEDVPNPKPFPDAVNMAIHHFRIEPVDAWMVGDKDVDVKAGKAAGTKTIGVTNGDIDQELIDSKPDHLVENISNVVPIVTKSV